MIVPCFPWWPRVWHQAYEMLIRQGKNPAEASRGAAIMLGRATSAEHAKRYAAQKRVVT